MSKDPLLLPRIPKTSCGPVFICECYAVLCTERALAVHWRRWWPQGGLDHDSVWNHSTVHVQRSHHLEPCRETGKFPSPGTIENFAKAKTDQPGAEKVCHRQAVSHKIHPVLQMLFQDLDGTTGLVFGNSDTLWRIRRHAHQRHGPR